MEKVREVSYKNDSVEVNDLVKSLIKEAGCDSKISLTEQDEFKESIKYRVEARGEVDKDGLLELIVREANERTTANQPHYSSLSSKTYLRRLYRKMAKKRGYDFGHEYKDYPELVLNLVEKGIYSKELTEAYSFNDLIEASTFLDKEKDKLFSYAGLFLLNKNYLAKDYDKSVVELPQERFLTVALYLMKNENKSQRMEYVKEAYWALSNHYVGLATPTLINSGRPTGTLSSCHILTMGDSLRSILDVISDTGRFCQNGAGIGIYLGNLRSDGSWIRNYKGNATGIVGPSKLLNEIANYVNQLNVRKGGIAAYLPIDHADIMDFLDLRLRTGSEERRAHAIFTAVTIPDEFMRRLNSKDNWTVFDPYEVKKKLGFDLHQKYDKNRLKEGEEPNPIDHDYTYHYRIAEKANLELARSIPAIEIYGAIFRARKTGGTPYLYFSDTAARFNPNDHMGMPLGSNLCSEIVQNMSEDEFKEEILHEDGSVVVVKRGEGLVTCNLSSLCLHNVFTQDVDLQRVTDIQYRMLDNVISLNRTAVPQAEYTNNLYRAVAAGQIGLQTLLAENGIEWDSWEAVEFTDKLMEKVAYANILSSHKLAMEKGSYPYFEGSKWNTGEYFVERGYNSPEWLELKEKVSKGIRNGYLMATAPTGSNSLITNGSPALDPLYDVVYLNKKEGMNATIVPPNYNFKTKRFYKSAFEMDEMWSIEIMAAAQKHIDQSISHNMHVSRNIKGSELLRLDNGAWEKGLKTIYYTYSRNIDLPDDCRYCQ